MGPWLLARLLTCLADDETLFETQGLMKDQQYETLAPAALTNFQLATGLLFQISSSRCSSFLYPQCPLNAGRAASDSQFDPGVLVSVRRLQ